MQTNTSSSSSSSSTTPLPVLFEQAMAMKESQLAEDRRKFDRWPTWYRNSLYTDEEILRCRKSASLDEKIAYVEQKKEKAKALFENKYYVEAIFEYEQALSIFNWIEHKTYNGVGGIKGGIKDEDLIEKEFVCKDSSYLELITQSKTSCQLNIATCLLKLNQWDDVVDACNHILTKNKDCARAYHKRGMARDRNERSTLSDKELALKDLETAKKLGGAAYVKDYNNLSQSIKIMKQKERDVFGGFLQQKGGVVDSSSGGDVAATSANDGDGNSNNNNFNKSSNPKTRANKLTSQLQQTSTIINKKVKKMPATSASAQKDEETEADGLDDVAPDSNEESYFTAEQIEGRILDMQRMAEYLQSTGEVEEANRILEQVKECRNILDTAYEMVANKEEEVTEPGQIWDQISMADYMNPSEEMVFLAKEKGIDITDKKVQELMAEIHKETLNFRGTSEGDSIFSPDLTTEERENKLSVLLERSVCRLRRTMCKEMSEKIVKVIKKTKYREMLLVRRIGVYTGRTELDDLKGPQVDEIISMTEDEVIAKIKELDTFPEDKLQAMLVASITDDLVDFEHSSTAKKDRDKDKKEEGGEENKENKDKDKDNSDVTKDASHDDSKTDDNKSEVKDASSAEALDSADSNNTAPVVDPNLNPNLNPSSDPAKPDLKPAASDKDKNNELFIKIFDMLYEKYGGKETVQLEGEPDENERKDDSYLSWLPMGVAIVFGLIFLVLHIIAFYHKQDNATGMVHVDQPQSKPKPPKKTYFGSSASKDGYDEF